MDPTSGKQSGENWGWGFDEAGSDILEEASMLLRILRQKERE